jgi:hypothetical protein
MKKAASPEKQLDGFIDRYTPEIAAQARACLKTLRSRMPGAIQLVYDNYNALVIGFGPTARPSEAIFSLVLYPRYLRLFFFQGKRVPDPDKLLEGKGNVVRSILISSPSDLNRPDIRELMATAMESGKTPLNPAASGQLIIRSISEKKRPRRMY